jgi:hypothetical protein
MSEAYTNLRLLKQTLQIVYATRFQNHPIQIV